MRLFLSEHCLRLFEYFCFMCLFLLAVKGVCAAEQWFCCYWQQHMFFRDVRVELGGLLVVTTFEFWGFRCFLKMTQHKTVKDLLTNMEENGTMKY